MLTRLKKPKSRPSSPPPPSIEDTKYKISITQPANGKIEVSPALPADGKVDKGSELTFTLSANTGHKVKELIINGITYSAVTDNTITKKVKIEKNTAVSAVVEAEATPTPDTGIFTDTQGNKVTIAPVDIYGGEIIGYRLTGDIYIEEINSEAFKAKLDMLNGKELYTDSLNINCFANQNSTITAKEITPELLTGVLIIGKEKKFSAFRLNNQTQNGPVDIKFDSSEKDFFDIKDLNKFSFSNNFKLEINSKIILGSKAKKITGPLNHDLTPYPKVGELLTLLQNSKLKSYITVKDVYITGNVKDLLPLLVGPNSIKEVNGGVKFLNHTKFSCDEINLTEYKGEENNTVPIALEQFLEFRKRTDEVYNTVLKINTKPLYLANLVLENIDTTQLNENKLKFLHFNGDSVGGKVIFKNSNLSKMQYRGTTGPVDLTFNNTILPTDMLDSEVSTLILKNAKLPEELKETDPEDLPYRLPNINNNLKIFNLELLNKWTEADLSTLNKVKHPPEKYVGPKNVWDKFKHLYLDEGTKTHFTNEDLTDTPLEDINFSSIQKQQSQLLALLQTQNKSRG